MIRAFVGISWFLAVLGLAACATGAGTKAANNPPPASGGPDASVARAPIVLASIHDAVEAGDMARLRKLLAQGADVESEDRDHITPLSRAVYLGNIPLIKALLKHGAQVNHYVFFGPRGGGSALHVAAYTGHAEAAQLLLQKGADVNIGLRFEDDPPLLVALQQRQLPIVMLLLEHGAEFNFQGRAGYRLAPMHMAACFAPAAVAFMVKHGADVNILDMNGRTPLHVATCSGNLETIKLLQGNGGVAKAKNDFCNCERLATGGLFGAVTAGDTDRIRSLIAEEREQGRKRGWKETAVVSNAVNPHDVYRNTPLIRAVMLGKFEVVKALVEHGAHINAAGDNNYTALHRAVDAGSLDIVRLLIDKGAGVNFMMTNPGNGNTPLHRAAMHGRTEIARLLIEKGANPNAWSAEYRTPLHYAAADDNLQMVRLLLDKGADLYAARDSQSVLTWLLEHASTEVMQTIVAWLPDTNEKNRSDWRLMDWALSRNRADMVGLLLQRGADPNAVHADAGPLLHWAADRGDLSLIRLLLKKGADINIRSARENTALHRTITENRTEVVKFLIEKGADVNARNDVDNAPLHMAATRGQREMVELLVGHGANVLAKGSNSETPADKASKNGFAELAQRLADHKN